MIFSLIFSNQPIPNNLLYVQEPTSGLLLVGSFNWEQTGPQNPQPQSEKAKKSRCGFDSSIPKRTPSLQCAFSNRPATVHSHFHKPTLHFLQLYSKVAQLIKVASAYDWPEYANTLKLGNIGKVIFRTVFLYILIKTVIAHYIR